MTSALPENWPAMSIADANAALAASDSPLRLGDAVINGVKMKVYVNAPATIREIFEQAEPAFAAPGRLQFLTIRQYLSLVFLALVSLLLVLALWG